MFKKGSLELSVNAIVVIVIAITMLGLGLGFLRGIFSNSLGQVENQLKGLEQERINSLVEGCDSGLCLETRKMDIKKNEQKDMWIALFNNFDCDLTGTKSVILYVGSKTDTYKGGSGTTSFTDTMCSILGSDGKCGDISIETSKTKAVKQKTKEPILVRVKAKSSAKPTIYTYDIMAYGACGASDEFKLEETMSFDVNVEG